MSGGRNDNINAKDGDDTVSSGGGNDTVHAGSGKDLVYAGSGNDRIFGEASRDTLDGGSGHDTLVGGDGKDVLKGGRGDDLLTGDGDGSSSEDVFVYDANNFGDDIITDFDLSQDVLEIKAGINGSGIAQPADLAPYITEVGGSAVISFGNGDSITLQGITKADLLAGLNDAIDIT
ncbi:calcium-binding protein [Roseomonas sp. BU-1]|uniref:Calcium-binding protein n=2 Tax=Falsiroseomonas selenitidurans TaxID=2716335 RepID=A0ABX1DXI0_9PROT|nr:calcium-binding protein [Falsiroseomonas selenitidurans]